MWGVRFVCVWLFVCLKRVHAGLGTYSRDVCFDSVHGMSWLLPRALLTVWHAAHTPLARGLERTAGAIVLRLFPALGGGDGFGW